MAAKRAVPGGKVRGGGADGAPRMPLCRGAACVWQRRGRGRAERAQRETGWQRLEYEVSGLLGLSESLAETVPKLLRVLARSFGWDIGEFWEAAGTPRKLRLAHFWHAPDPRLSEYVRRSLKFSLALLDGLPGRALTGRRPCWIPELARWPGFERRQLAKRAGLRSAMVFPILFQDRALGVMAFLSRRGAEPDAGFLRMLVTLGRQIGQFMERKRAEQALREAHEFGRQVIGGAQAGIIVYDRRGRFMVWNPFMEEMTGYRAADVLGRRAVVVFPFLREQQFEQNFRRALAGEAFEAADIPFDLARTGKRGWTAARFAPLRNARREIVGVIVAVRDITDRRRLESELLEISEREQRRIGQDLHDGLGQQLTALEMKSFLLLEDLAVADLAARREYLCQQAHQISHGLRECITFTRSLARGLAPVNLKAEGLAGALRQLAHAAAVPGKVQCRFDCSASLNLNDAQVAGQLYRIAQEAVTNALKHARTSRIRISLMETQGQLRLQVRDHGRGLPKGLKPGAGMGLEVMRHRAHVIGATLELGSRAGRGVIVTCALPLPK